MAGADFDPRAGFEATFPDRFSQALEDARGAFAGIAASGSGGLGLLDAERLRRLHEIYRLRVELEIETAAVLWRTAELVRALTDSIQMIERRARPSAGFAGEPFGGLDGGEVEGLREQVALIGERPRRGSRSAPGTAFGAEAA